LAAAAAWYRLGAVLRRDRTGYRGGAAEGRKVLALTLVLKHASGLDEAARATLAAAAGALPASGPHSQRARPRA
jgi:hypothetical protein